MERKDEILVFLDYVFIGITQWKLSKVSKFQNRSTDELSFDPKEFSLHLNLPLVVGEIYLLLLKLHSQHHSTAADMFKH